MSDPRPTASSNQKYWDGIADKYSTAICISLSDFHYGPLVPGDSVLGLLPSSLDGLRCLEIGCGGGQNSVFLAGRGAECVAVDVSGRQLGHAAKNAKRAGVNVRFLRMPMEKLAPLKGEKFDLIHSSYALAFSRNPGGVVAEAARLLSDGGVMLVSNGHPLHSGSWTESGDGSGVMGLFLRDYFRPEPDARFDERGEELVRAEFYPLGAMADWFLSAGLSIERILEPEPARLDGMSLAEARKAVPYVSKGWLGLYERLRRVPSVVIFKCVKRGRAR